MTTTSQKIAVVTGGSRGLGRATALRLANLGVGVVLTYRSQRAEADRVVTDITDSGGTAVALQLDTAVTAGFEDFADRLRAALTERWASGTFDYLVNNAGTNVTAPFADTTEKDFDDLVNVHFKGVFFLTQTVLPLIADGGAIVNVSTGLTRFTVPGQAAYAAMKGAIEVLTRYQARELGARGIRVNAIAPGATATDFGNGLVRDNEQVRAYLTSQVALGRIGEPDDIGPAVAALLSDDNRWMTAQRVEVSGGQSL
jgi:NAD(P)-dependent dehydrogenase (short-subunit alcohol dehydrogenase family)